jgi:hypothetical protein
VTKYKEEIFLLYLVEGTEQNAELKKPIWGGATQQLLWGKQALHCLGETKKLTVSPREK